ncbi:MAG: amidohydrolase, partial [Traorella sp.]
MKKEELKEIVCDKIDEQKEKIYAIGNQIYHHPELGYKEKQTSKLVSDLFDELRLSYEKQLAVTGIKAKLHDNKKGINIAIVSELDAVVCPNHKDSDSNSGAAHTCGHFAQIAAMLGCAIGLNEIKDQLDGNVSFIAAPAEECVEIEYRQSLIEKGVIHYLGGKQEMIHQHVFDDVDMAMLIHGMRVDDHIKATSFGTGFIAKTIYFKGKEAHAGLEPWKGINALSAANLAMQAIQYVKDSFDPLNCTRIHYFMSKGGTLVNIVPNDVRIEMYIRSSSIESIKEANSKVNQAIKGSAYALGCDVTIQDSPGYLPLISDLNLGEVFKQNAQMIC